MEKFKLNFIWLLLLVFLCNKEVFGGCSSSEFMPFAKCVFKYSKTEFGQKAVKEFDDFETLCSDFLFFQQCMGNSIINHCANIKGFTRIFQSQNSAIKYFADHLHKQWICEKGYKIIDEDSFKCVMETKNDCEIKHRPCDVLQDDLDECSNNVKRKCGENGYNYVYNKYAIANCLLNSNCQFLEETCSEVNDYTNPPSEEEHRYVNAVRTAEDPESALYLRLIYGQKINAEEINKMLSKFNKNLRALENVEVVNNHSDEFVQQQRFVATWILRHLARRFTEFDKISPVEFKNEMKCNIPLLINLLNISNMDIKEQAILALGDIIGCDSTYRDYCIEQGIIAPLLKTISSDGPIKIKRHVAWVIMHIIWYDDIPLSKNDMDNVLNGISTLIDVEDMFILVDIFHGLFSFSIKNSTNIQLLIEHGIIKSVIKHLSRDDLKVYAAALQVIVTLQKCGTKEQNEYLRDYRVSVRSEVHGSYKTYHEEF